MVSICRFPIGALTTTVTGPDTGHLAKWDLSCERENKSSCESHFDVPTNCSALVRMYGLSSVFVTS